MAITKNKKREVVAKVTDALQKATSAVFVRFHKLPVTQTSAMRKVLKEEGVGYFVAKKSLMKRALSAHKVDGTLPELPGEVALAWSADDPTAAPRGIYEHAKKHKDALTILGGIFEGAFVDAKRMTAIATIPSIPVLRGMFVNVINSPIQGLAIALKAIADKKA
jgi:large subunit ribosomal protein L10